ncbi:hypothetical protein M8J77_013170 [Diaphorina citri]|nr:hypothetical protein M8J77_013170 [Diaphorina citri]
MFFLGKLVGYHLVFDTTNRRKLLFQKTMITIVSTMAMCAVVRQTYWVIMNKQVEIRVSGIEIIFRLESHSLTPVFNLIYLYRHRRQFFRIRKYMRSYYDHLTRAQKSHFYWIYWKVVIAQFATVASELFFFLSWSLLILHFDNISSSTLDMVSIVYSTIWYLYPMLQYYLYLHILHRSLYNSCAQLHAKGLDTERLQCIALNVRSVMRLCDLVNGYYGKPVLLGMMCSVVDFVFFPYLYIYASSYFLRLIDDSYTDNVMALVTACCVFMKLATIFPLFHACETLYQQVIYRVSRERLYNA